MFVICTIITQIQGEPQDFQERGLGGVRAIGCEEIQQGDTTQRIPPVRLYQDATFLLN